MEHLRALYVYDCALCKEYNTAKFKCITLAVALHTMYSKCKGGLTLDDFFVDLFKIYITKSIRFFHGLLDYSKKSLDKKNVFDNYMCYI